MEFDHLFICVSPAAVEVEAFAALGFSEGTANTHPGQGTSCRRFFCNNAFVEFLVLENADEALDKRTSRTGLYQRLTDNSGEVSPFGMCFRPASGSADAGCPFNSWQYQPVYLPPNLHVDVAATSLAEPMWFYLSFASRPDQATADRRQNLLHPNAVENLTSVEIEIPGNLSAEAQTASTLAEVSITGGEDHLAVLCFDNGRQSKICDLRPTLPLIVKF